MKRCKTSSYCTLSPSTCPLRATWVLSFTNLNEVKLRQQTCSYVHRAPLGPLQRAKSLSESPQGIQEIPQNCLWCRVWRPDSPFWISAGSCGSVWNKGLFNVFCNVQQALNGPNDSLLFSHLNVTRRNLVNPASLFRADGALWVIVVGLVSLASFCAAETRTLWMMEEGDTCRMHLFTRFTR